MRLLRAILFFASLAIGIVFFTCTSTRSRGSQKGAYSPVSKELYDTIAHMDSIFFAAFNMKNLVELKALLSQDLEFYHDLGGFTSYDQNIEAFNRAFGSERKVRRELAENSLEIYPVKDYGAIETGIHRFYATEKGQPEELSSEAKFVHVWRKEGGEWKISRIISYGHQEYIK